MIQKFQNRRKTFEFPPRDDSVLMLNMEINGQSHLKYVTKSMTQLSTAISRCKIARGDDKMVCQCDQR